MATVNYLHQIHCPHHPDAPLIEDYRAGDMICPECGLVVGDRTVDVGTEWRTFSNDKDRKDMSRVGDSQNSFLSGGGLSTRIEQPTGSSGMTNNGYLQYSGRTTFSNGDQVLIRAFREISGMADRIHLPKNIVDRSHKLFKQVYESKSLRGKSNDAISAACLYIACREERVPRTFKEICAISGISKKVIGRAFKFIVKKLENDIENITSDDFMSRFCSNLSLPSCVQRAATHIAKKAAAVDLVAGRSPLSVAAAAIYMASQVSKTKKSQKDISEISGVAEATIRQCYNLMLGSANILFPTGFKFDIPICQLPRS